MKKRALAAMGIVVIAIALDLRRPPPDQWTTAATVSSIHLYQSTMSPLYARMGFKCRFTVTCSHYGEEAIRKYGGNAGYGLHLLVRYVGEQLIGSRPRGAA